MRTVTLNFHVADGAEAPHVKVEAVFDGVDCEPLATFYSLPGEVGLSGATDRALLYMQAAQAALNVPGLVNYPLVYKDESRVYQKWCVRRAPKGQPDGKHVYYYEDEAVARAFAFARSNNRLVANPVVINPTVGLPNSLSVGDVLDVEDLVSSLGGSAEAWTLRVAALLVEAKEGTCVHDYQMEPWIRRGGSWNQPANLAWLASKNLALRTPLTVKYVEEDGA